MLKYTYVLILIFSYLFIIKEASTYSIIFQINSTKTSTFKSAEIN